MQLHVFDSELRACFVLSEATVVLHTFWTEFKVAASRMYSGCSGTVRPARVGWLDQNVAESVQRSTDCSEHVFELRSALARVL